MKYEEQQDKDRDVKRTKGTWINLGEITAHLGTREDVWGQMTSKGGHQDRTLNKEQDTQSVLSGSVSLTGTWVVSIKFKFLIPYDTTLPFLVCKPGRQRSR